VTKAFFPFRFIVIPRLQGLMVRPRKVKRLQTDPLANMLISAAVKCAHYLTNYLHTKNKSAIFTPYKCTLNRLT
ncbi:hypothetical protein, partial [Yersinia pestis]